MKLLVSVLASMLLFTGNISAQSGDSNEQTPQLAKSAITFKEMVHNFKTVDFNSDVSYSYVFTNTSNAPVGINRVTPSCGCTTTDYTKGPIMPGRTGTVSIKYDSSREGYFSKTVTVAIGDETYTLIFLGTVKPNPYGNANPPQNPVHN